MLLVTIVIGEARGLSEIRLYKLVLLVDIEVVTGEGVPSVEAFINGFNICGRSFIGLIKLDLLVVEALVDVSVSILVDISVDIFDGFNRTFSNMNGV